MPSRPYISLVYNVKDLSRSLILISEDSPGVLYLVTLTDKFLSVIDGLGGSDLILFGEGFWRDLASQSQFFLSWMHLQ